MIENKGVNSMDRDTAIRLLNEMALEETALSQDMTKEGKERSTQLVAAIDAGIKAIEENRQLQNRCYALTHGSVCCYCLCRNCENRKEDCRGLQED